VSRGHRVSSRILDRYVLPDERIVVATRHHWAKLLEPAATVVVSFVLVTLISANAERAVGQVALGLWWVWLAVVARLVWRLLEWRNEWFVATDKRLLKTYGLITHKVAMMPLRKVTDMNYARSPFGRVLGYGQFLLESAGQDQAMRQIDWLPDPDDAYRRICDTIFGPNGQDPDEDGPDPGPPPPARRHTTGQDWSQPEDGTEDDAPGWEVSTEESSGYTPVRVPGRDVAEDPDITSPLPPRSGQVP